MDHGRKIFSVKEPYQPTPVHRCNATLGQMMSPSNKENREDTTEELSNRVLKKLTEISDQVSKISEHYNNVQKILCSHTVMLEKMCGKMFPQSNRYNIFPIKSVMDLQNSEELIKKEPHDEIILYIQELVGKGSLSATFPKLFSEEILLKLNWDGRKKKTAIKDYKLFNTMVFEAIKNASFGYEQYQEEMKKGFKIAKNRFYRKTYKLKTTK